MCPLVAGFQSDALNEPIALLTVHTYNTLSRIQKSLAKYGTVGCTVHTCVFVATVDVMLDIVLFVVCSNVFTSDLNVSISPLIPTISVCSDDICRECLSIEFSELFNRLVTVLLLSSYSSISESDIK